MNRSSHRFNKGGIERMELVASWIQRANVSHGFMIGYVPNTPGRDQIPASARYVHSAEQAAQEQQAVT